MDTKESLEIEAEVLAVRMQEGWSPAVIDVREPWEVDIVAFPGGINIPMAGLMTRLAELPRDGDVVVVCHLGGRSLQVAMWLRQNGIPGAVSLRGGIDAWARRIDDSLAVY